MSVSTVRVPFNDLSIQWRQIAERVQPGLQDLFAKSAFILGTYVGNFEKEAAHYLGVKHAFGVNSGTSALHLAMLASGIGAGDAVLVPAHSFIATVWGALYVGATPIFCDVDNQTGTIDLKDAERRLTPHVKAIIPVHLYGQPADMATVAAFADLHCLEVIEDAAQSFGAQWGGRHVGTIGQIGCFSFYPGKNLGAVGEAGLVVTDDDAIAEKIRALRDHGQRERYVHDHVGYNYRMDGIQGLVLSEKLKRLDAWTAERRALAIRYQDRLAGSALMVPQIVNKDHVWHLFVVRTPQRDALRRHLAQAGIETGLHYPLPLHRQPCLLPYIDAHQAFPAAEQWAAEGLSLPLYVGMTAAQVDFVADAILDFLN